ncbi:glycine cleavage T C-terminal barrel domain-containing protein [Salibaculum sp.]|uniref:glycine cleavage T C-terminal barrel domain-containing protein n=1 Tax=Salibaculum sp. TaxID=2855480 RepID=UPI002B465569|nr:glycine cleavage T C-terminal barrel domain-containing protein [Salibaculum sp.]HKL68941.1 glycine cleavage T C-terminal barrel domain-containing protein [Salibaculum sp.]
MNPTSNRTVPVNLRQSGAPRVDMLIGTRVRKSPFWHKSVEHGARAVTVYNRMYHPRLYFSQDEGGLLGEYDYLKRHVTLWNVAVERQIQIKGPDATAFVDFLVTRAMTGDKELSTGKARYVILCNRDGGIVNDPVLLRIAEDEYWLSISDSDLALWAQGVNVDGRFDATVRELDVAPVQLQGPDSASVLRDAGVADVKTMKFFNLRETTLFGCDVVISKTGFSGEEGFEIYLRNATRDADALWDGLVAAGEPYHLRVIAPNHISRMEAGILSYGQDMDFETTPYEVGLDWQVNLDKADFIGKTALEEVAARGVAHKLVGLTFGGRQIDWYNADFWPVLDPEMQEEIGYVTSAFYSPGVGANIAFARVPVARATPGRRLLVRTPASVEPIPAETCATPFTMPERGLNRPVGMGDAHGTD